MIKGKAAIGEETSTCGWELSRGVEVVTIPNSSDLY
jgi:hypothetical protein